MKKGTPDPLVVGARAMLRIGSPVRQWLHTLGQKSETWLTPVRYGLASQYTSPPQGGPQYVEVRIAKIMATYAIVDHYNGRQWVRLWLDIRRGATAGGRRVAGRTLVRRTHVLVSRDSGATTRAGVGMAAALPSQRFFVN